MGASEPRFGRTLAAVTVDAPRSGLARSCALATVSAHEHRPISVAAIGPASLSHCDQVSPFPHAHLALRRFYPWRNDGLRPASPSPIHGAGARLGGTERTASLSNGENDLDWRGACSLFQNGRVRTHLFERPGSDSSDLAAGPHLRPNQRWTGPWRLVRPGHHRSGTPARLARIAG